jgi:cytochrome c biogenesis protein CcmG/thiol:disulfide interchange protein DsbE
VHSAFIRVIRERQMTEVATPSKSRLRFGWLAAFGVIVALLLLVGLTMTRSGRGQVAVGEPAPDFSLTAFDGTALEGRSFALSEARGTVVLLNFWASWCIECRPEAAALEQAWQTYKARGLKVIGLAWADGSEADSLAFIREHNQTFLLGPDLGTRAGQAYRITGVPETYLIDQNGLIVWRKIGPTNFTELQSVIEPVLR